MYGYEEHLQDSAPDNSRFDGFCRGDAGREIEQREHDEMKATVIGRMHCCHGKVEIIEVSMGFDTGYFVQVEGKMVTPLVDKDQAITVGHWWINGARA